MSTTAVSGDDGNAAVAEAVSRKLFYTPEGRANPYPLYRELRAADPVHRMHLGMWLLSRYDDCWAMMRDPRFGKAYAPMVEQRFGAEWRAHRSLTAQEHSMLNTTGAEHARLRKLVTKSFTPRMIESLKPSIQRTVDELLDPIDEAGGGEVLEALAFPLPVTVIGEMLGVPAPDRAQFRPLVRDLVAIFEMQPTSEQMNGADAAAEQTRSYFLDLIARKRREPGEDLLSALVQVEVNGDRLTDDELVTMATLLFAAGFETTTNLIGNGLLALLRHPDQLALLHREPALFASLSDELLRYDGTAQLVNRVTEAAVEIGGVTIPAGEQVFALLGAGNHDPARYADPDRLDLRRTEINPLSFGGGVHFCLGAALARVEIESVFRTLLRRFDAIELAGEPPRFQDRLTLRGLTALHVACRPAAGAHPAEAAAAPASQPAPSAAPQIAPVERGLRPGGTGPAADLAWREQLRQRIETKPAREDSLPLRTGRQLAAAVALIGRNRLFNACTPAELAELAATAYPMSFEPGDLLCVEGADAPEAYVIQVGHAVVTIGRKGVATVGPEDIVGERGPLLGAARAATVTATTHMITFALSRERLRALMDMNPRARDWMLAEMQRRYPPRAPATAD